MKPLQPRRPGRDAIVPVAAVAGLALVIALLHGGSLGYGLYLDDWAHFRQLRAADWSLGGLVDACRLELVGGAIEMWWLPETTLRFFRPVAFGLMKLVYTLSGWSPVAAHAASLGWHLLVCVLLWGLMRRFGASALLAWCVAALFAIHPAHVATVQWIAAQSELMVTAFLLGSIACFARLRGWGACAKDDRASAAGARGGQADEPPGADAGSAPAPRSFAWGVAALALFALALGSRENAIMLPAVLLVVDGLHHRPTLRRAIPWHAALAAIAATYLLIRAAHLGGAALPPRPYVIGPGEPDFLRYVFDKVCYYVLGEFLLVPCVPIGGLAYLRSVPLAFYGLTALVVAVIAACARPRRRWPGVTLGAAALLLFMAPVLPAFESPHHLYLPATGAAVLVAALARPREPRAANPAGGAPNPDMHAERAAAAAAVAAPDDRPARRVRWGAALAFGLSFALLAVVTHFSTLALDTGRQVEALVIDEIAAAPVPIRSGDVIYYANMPMLAHYVQYAVQERLGLAELRVVALTWAPRILGVNSPTELRRIDAHTIEARIAGDRYFAGPFGRLVAQAHGRDITSLLAQPLERPLARGGYTISLAGVDERGITAVRFHFAERLDAPGTHLFWGSRTRWAARIGPGFWPPGDP